MISILSPKTDGTLAFGLRFLVLVLLLNGLYETARGTALEELMVDRLTVEPGAALINLFSTDQNVRAEGHRVIGLGTRLSVLMGCEGTETLFLLLAALLAYPASMGRKLTGILIGSLVVYGLNLVRLSALYFALRHDRQTFEILHGYLAPLVMIFCCYLFFRVWMNARTPQAHA